MGMPIESDHPWLPGDRIGAPAEGRIDAALRFEAPDLGRIEFERLEARFRADRLTPEQIERWRRPALSPHHVEPEPVERRLIRLRLGRFVLTLCRRSS